MKKLCLIASILALVLASASAFAGSVTLQPGAYYAYENRPPYGSLSVSNTGTEDGLFRLYYPSGDSPLDTFVQRFSTETVHPTSWPLNILNTGPTTLMVTAK